MFTKLSLPRNIDRISDLKFSTLPLNQNHLFVSSWNDQIYLYDYDKAGPNLGPLAIFDTSSTPISLHCAETGFTFVGFLNGTIGEIDFENGKVNLFDSVNSHLSSPINYIKSFDQNSIIATLIAGELISVDTRQQRATSRFDVSESSSLLSSGTKIFAMDACQSKLTLGLSSNSIAIYDSRDLLNPQEIRDLGLKHQIRDLKVNPDQKGFAVSTIDGRILMECYSTDPLVQSTNQFAFKCHRVYDKPVDTDIVYSVNSLAFHPSQGSLFTGGSDGAVCIWDITKRKRMKMYPKFMCNGAIESVEKIDLSGTNDLLAVATSDDSYLRVKADCKPEGLGVMGGVASPPGLYIRHLDISEVMPRK